MVVVYQQFLLVNLYFNIKQNKINHMKFLNQLFESARSRNQKEQEKRQANQLKDFGNRSLQNN